MQALEDLLNNPMVDVAYIAVPHYLLAPLSRQVLEAGKHALTEKPLAISLEEVDAVISLAARQQRVLGVFYEMRYAPANAPARELIQAGAIGDVVGIQIQTLIDKPLTYWQSGYSARSVNPWRGIKSQAGGGVVLMNASHLLDTISCVTGLRVTRVSAEIGTLVSNVQVEDMAAATLRFDNGAIGSLMAAAHASGAHGEECCYLYGTAGQIRLPDPYGSDPLRIYLKQAWGEYAPAQWHSIPTKPVSVHQLAIEDFVAAVQSGGSAAINALATRQVLAVILAIYQSAAENRAISIS
jgi:predicted dehydrogenase